MKNISDSTLTYADLIERMTDLSRLAVLPEDGEKCGQWSSYDRHSRFDAKTGKYVDWGANDDSVGCIRQEGRQIVMAEMEGPGCIWRVWSASAQKGHVKIYLDAQEVPAVDLPFENYFTGDTAPFDFPELSYNLGQTIRFSETQTSFNGQNLYQPIPYRKSCKIVADEGWGQFYHFTYSTFPKGTVVPTFSTALAVENAEALRRATDFFAKRLGEDPAGIRPGQETLCQTVTIGAGQTAQVACLKGPQAITAVKVRMSYADRDDQIAALRMLALQITWDGQATPAVWCPLGDFFGTAPGENFYKSLIAGMTEDGYYAYWYMPFGKNATVELVNDDKLARNVEIEIVHVPLPGPFDGLGHFHAKWHRDTFALSKDRWPDWVMLRATGRGRFCGVMLHVWTPLGGWWGEGDEKFFVDGEKFPSTFGTGTEDYFGYANSCPALFQRPYHCQTMSEQNQGNQALLRWHVADNVPFHASFEGCIEKYDNVGPEVKYACTVYWYLSPEGGDPYRPTSTSDREDYFSGRTVTVAGIEVIRPTQVVVGKYCQQAMDSAWRDGDQLRWYYWSDEHKFEGHKSAKLSFRLPPRSAGVYRIVLGLMKARNCPIAQFHLDGEKLGGPVDLYEDTEAGLFSLAFGPSELMASEHVLTVEVAGVNCRASTKNPCLGLDYIDVVPVQ